MRKMNCKDCRKNKKCERKKKVKGCALYSPKYDYRKCFLCGRSGAIQEHHIFPGPLRKWSDRYGLTVDLCPQCHLYGEHAAHVDARTAVKLKRIGQVEFEKAYGAGTFIHTFGKNYIEMD